MGGFADVKRSRLYSLLRWIETKDSVTVSPGGKHEYLVKHSSWARPFPVPTKHNVVNKYIIKRLMEQLVMSGVCTEDEFRDHLK